MFSSLRWSKLWSFNFFMSSKSLNLRSNYWISDSHNTRLRHDSKLICKNFNFLINIKFENRSEWLWMIRVNHCEILFWIQILNMVVFIQQFTSLINLLNNSLNVLTLNIRLDSLYFIDEKFLLHTRFIISINVVFDINNVDFSCFFVFSNDGSEFLIKIIMKLIDFSLLLSNKSWLVRFYHFKLSSILRSSWGLFTEHC